MAPPKLQFGKGHKNLTGETPILYHPSHTVNHTSRESRRRAKEKERQSTRQRFIALAGCAAMSATVPHLPNLADVTAEPDASPSALPPYLSVRAALPFWRDTLRAPPQVLRLIREGISFDFVNGIEPPPIYVPPYQLPTDQMQWIYDHVQMLVQTQHVSPPLSYRPYCCQAVFVVAKGSSYRFVYDSVPLNAFVTPRSFSTEDISFVITMLRVYDFACSVDVESAFYILGIAGLFLKYMGFSIRNPQTGVETYHLWFVNPFGFIRAGEFFHTMVVPLIKFWRRQGHRVTFFGDDFLGLVDGKDGVAGSKTLCDMMLADAGDAGLRIKLPKVFFGLQDFVHIGYRLITLPPMQLGIKPQRLMKTTSVLQLICSSPHASARQVSSAAGSVLSMLIAVGSTAFLYTRALYQFVTKHVKKHSKQSWNQYFPLPDSAQRECQFWLKFLAQESTVGRPGPFRTIHRLPLRPVIIAAGDASATGIGITMIQCPESVLHTAASASLTTAEQLRGSVVREMILLRFFMRTYRDINRGRRVIALTDASGARQATRYGSAHPQIQTIALDIDAIVREDDVDLQVLWWPRSGVGATIGDDLSREAEGDVCDFYLLPAIYAEICCSLRRAPPTYDLYADTTNRKATTFFSRTFMEGSSGINAVDQIVPPTTFAYACPPPRGTHICEFLRSVFHDCTYLLIIPAWVNTPHYPLLFSADNIPRAGVHMLAPLAASVFRRGPIGTPNYIEGKSTHYTTFWVIILDRYGTRLRSPRGTGSRG
jgi:hypothetical protein